MYWLMFENPKNNFQDVIAELNDLKGMMVTEYGLVNILRNKFGLKVELNDKMKYVGWEKFDYYLEHGMEMNQYNEIVRVCVPECPKELVLRREDKSPTIAELIARIELIDERIDTILKVSEDIRFHILRMTDS